jgi:phosphoribosylanthranilate isomerase
MMPAAAPAGSPQVKICGVCSAQDAGHAARAGATYVGVILAPGRQRTLAVAEAESVFAGCPVQRVGVFVDAPPAEVLVAAERLRLDAVQLHGAESPAVAELLAAELPAQIWKAVAVRSAADVDVAVDRFAGVAHALVLDGWSPAGHGGTGSSFDWEEAAAARGRVPGSLRVIVAGGLTPDNVGGVVALLRPDVVDVSSGVEAAPRSKSAERVQEFVRAAWSAGAFEG